MTTHIVYRTCELWQAPLDVAPDALASFEASLSVEERARADALRGGLLRRRYVADHGWRRRLLARLLGCPETEIVYARGEHGKPRLSGSTLGFNASRSGGTALYLTCEGAEVGVDVEEIRAGVNVAGMARRFFSLTERVALEAVPAAHRTAAAFACWTRKEAYAKAVGTGLVFPLSEVEVWVGDDRPVRHGDVEVIGVDVGPGMAGAAAIRVAPGTPASVPCKAGSLLNPRFLEKW